MIGLIAMRKEASDVRSAAGPLGPMGSRAELEP